MSYEAIQKDLQILASPEKASHAAMYFKTGKGWYAEGDIFLWVTVPNQRAIAKRYYQTINIDDITALIQSDVHEYRFTATELLTIMYTKTKSLERKKQIIDYYLAHIGFINNRDLVDNTAYVLLGNYLLESSDRSLLYEYAQSWNLRKQRIAIIATYAFIKQGDFEDTIAIATILLQHKHDLIHKAVGWMLREVANRDQWLIESFLHQHMYQMPRTMLRYAIEKFDTEKRKYYLQTSRKR